MFATLPQTNSLIQFFVQYIGIYTHLPRWFARGLSWRGSKSWSAASPWSRWRSGRDSRSGRPDEKIIATSYNFPFFAKQLLTSMSIMKESPLVTPEERLLHKSEYTVCGKLEWQIKSTTTASCFTWTGPGSLSWNGPAAGDWRSRPGGSTPE